MRLTWILFSVLVALAYGQDSSESSSEEERDELPLAELCNAAACQLPDCRCSSTNIPGGLSPRDTPQFVLLTFDDGVNINNIETYRDILYGRFNSDNCPIGVTYFINHEYTNYQLVNELYNRGYEISLHSISHQTPQSYWAEATYEQMRQEFADQRVQMSHFANIPIDSINGIRKPFLQMAGNATFEVMANHGLTYDSSWPTISFTNPGLWPYTLDFASNQDCQIEPCPTASIPGVWVSPMVAWFDLQNFPCSMVDACVFFPDRTDEQAWYEFIVQNFERHYLNNRAPFGFYIHESYLSAYPAVRNALVKFMDLISNLNDAFMVTNSEVINWVRNPVPIPEYKQQPCRITVPTTCPASTCVLTAAHNDVTYWMAVCNVCPRVYPWLGNPLGQ